MAPGSLPLKPAAGPSAPAGCDWPTLPAPQGSAGRPPQHQPPRCAARNPTRILGPARPSLRAGMRPRPCLRHSFRLAQRPAPAESARPSRRHGGASPPHSGLGARQGTRPGRGGPAGADAAGDARGVVCSATAAPVALTGLCRACLAEEPLGG